MDTWIHGYMDTWIHGYMDTWIHGYMVILHVLGKLHKPEARFGVAGPGNCMRSSYSLWRVIWCQTEAPSY